MWSSYKSASKLQATITRISSQSIPDSGILIQFGHVNYTELSTVSDKVTVKHRCVQQLRLLALLLELSGYGLTLFWSRLNLTEKSIVSCKNHQHQIDSTDVAEKVSTE